MIDFVSSAGFRSYCSIIANCRWTAKEKKTQDAVAGFGEGGGAQLGNKPAQAGAIEARKPDELPEHTNRGCRIVRKDRSSCSMN